MLKTQACLKIKLCRAIAGSSDIADYAMFIELPRGILLQIGGKSCQKHLDRVDKLSARLVFRLLYNNGTVEGTAANSSEYNLMP